MRLWGLSFSKSDEETNITVQTSPELQQYQIDLDPSPPLSVRIKETTVSFVDSIVGWSPTVQKTILALSLDLVCLVYQTVDLYKDIYPGSKVAANILRNSHTIVAWNIYYWTLAAAASTANFLVARQWVLWSIYFFRVEFWTARILRHPIFIGVFYVFVYMMIVPTLLVGPMWIAFAVRYAWADIAWSHGCPGWDYTIIFNVEYENYFTADLTWLGNVTVAGPRSNYTMALSQFTAFPNEYMFNITETFNFDSPLSFIWYNMTALTYTSVSSPIPFIITPNLEFPALGLSQRDPSIPFLRNDVSGYPPSADLVYKNGTRLLKTVTQNYPDLTKLLACGMEDYAGALQIALGVVAIEQWNSLNLSNNLVD
jgi:hypothetical protein